MAMTMVMSLAACGNSDVKGTVVEAAAEESKETVEAPVEEETAEPEAEETKEAEAEEAVEETEEEAEEDAEESGEFSIGTVAGKTYVNEYFGIKINVPDGYSFVDDETLAQLTGMTSDMLSDNEAVKEVIEDGTVSLVCYAMNESGLCNINATIQSNALVSNMFFDEEVILSASEEEVENVLKANAPFEMDRHLILAEEMKSFTKELANDADGEAKFLDYAGYTPGTAFGNSGNAWFVRRATSGGTGFRRGYDFGGRILRAEWKWHSNLWECSEDVHKRTPCTDCGHPSHYRCSCLPGPSFHAEVYADNGNSREKYYETEEKYKARPLVLAKDYFGAAGTITVGIARYNENPWYRVLSRTASIGEGVLGGIFGAFNPYRDVKWSWAFASSKAGYKSMGDSIDSRNYMVHWKDDSGDGTWNLCQSDWDAVFVPVRRAASRAEWNGEEKESEWTYSESAPLKEWVGSVESAEMPNLPGMHDSSGAIKNLNWNRLADLLYH